MQARASFVITSKSLSGAQITTAMGLVPARVKEIGEPIDKAQRYRRKHTSWTLESPEAKEFGDDVQQEFENLIDLLLLRKQALEKLRTAQCHMQWWVLGFRRSEEWGIQLTPDFLRLLSSFEADVYFDIHSHDETEPEPEAGAETGLS
jgi:hypothetical protein